MSLKHNFNHFRFLMNQGADLLLLRMQILGLDLTGQAAGLIKMLAAVVLGGVMLLAGIISLLFGLDAVLPAETKVWVFFGLPVLLLLLAWIFLVRALSAWKRAGVQVASTLADIRHDIGCLRGRHAAAETTSPPAVKVKETE